jgi:hypothetical protein
LGAGVMLEDVLDEQWFLRFPRVAGVLKVADGKGSFNPAW